MDIWAWVGETVEVLRMQEHARLADLIEELPRAVLAGRHDHAEALVPEAVALARAIDHPWIEVFVRHWLMQSRILHRCDVTSGLAEVIHLLDYAHGERTRECPQSVCVAQDVASAYGVLDGPGFARERIEVSQETLARIDPTWPCFECISGEQISAMLDDRQFAEAERFCRAQLDQMAQLGGEPPWAVCLNLCDALTALGRPAEALATIARLSDERAFPTRHVRYLLAKCRALADLGRADEAHACFVAAEPLQPEFFVAWARCARRLSALGVVRNDAELGTRVRRLARKLRANGSRWNLGRLVKIGAQLAIARNAHHIARLEIATGRALLSELRKPERLERDLSALADLCLPVAAAAPEDVDAFLAALGDDPEACLPELVAAHEAHPGHEGLVCTLARAFRALAFPEQAEEVLRSYVAHATSAESALDELARLWLQEGKHELLAKLVDDVPESVRAMVLWYSSLGAELRGHLDEAAQSIERALALEPEARRLQSRLALLYRRLQRPAEALSLLDGLVQGGEPGDDDWERMVVATQLGEHAKVRESAARLGFEFEGEEGPIDEPYAYCEIKLRDEQGREAEYRGLRISPVTARIISIVAPGARQRYGDVVLFDPEPLNPRPTDDEQANQDGDETEKKPPIFVFRAIQVLSPGGFRSYEVDGVHPGKDALDALRKALQELGAILSVRSDESYTLYRQEDEEGLAGVYAFIAAPASLPTADLHACLHAQTSAWVSPVTYRGLLQELGLDDDLARHRALAEELGLD
jgi:tetratricopeptide (TPR) repeat protein